MKLGLSAGIGILLVVGMLANDHFSKQRLRKTTAEVEIQGAVTLGALAHA
jgi:hypothetical protein